LAAAASGARCGPGDRTIRGYRILNGSGLDHSEIFPNIFLDRSGFVNQDIILTRMCYGDDPSNRAAVQ
jgi:hypothetical protein